MTKSMVHIPDTAEAQEILEEYNKGDFHIYHAKVLSGVLRYFAKEYDPGREEFWAAVGMLHDLDFELYPEEHCIKTQEILREKGIDESLIRAAASHGYGLTGIDFKPEHVMEKILYTVDELTGIIGAAALMRPSRSVMDMELKSVKKKYKTPSFAAGCSREVIEKGAQMLDMDLDMLIQKTLLAMRSLNGSLEV